MRNILALSAGIFVALAWLIPSKYPPWTSFYNDFSLFFGLWLWLLCSVLTTQRSVLINRWVLACGAIASVPFSQILMTQITFSGDAWITTLYLAAFAVAAGVGVNSTQKLLVDLPYAAAQILLVAAISSCAISLCQWLQIHGPNLLVSDLGVSNRPSGNLAQPNNLASLLCLGIAAALYLQSIGKISAGTTTLLLGYLIFGVALTSSRTSLAVAGFAIFWICWKYDWSRSRWRLLALTLIGTAYYTHLLYVDLPALAEHTDLGGAGRANLSENQPRLWIWRQALAAIQQSPWTGYGWNQVTTAQLTVAADFSSHLMFASSHNILLDLLIWNGIPLGLLIIGFVGYWLISRAIACRTRESWYALLCIGILLIHGMLELPLEYAYFLLPLGFFCGVVEANHPGSKTFSVSRHWLWLPIVIGAVFLVWVWKEYRLIEEDYRLMRFETLRIGTLKADQPAPDVVLLTQLREDLRFARSKAREGMTAAELEEMRRVVYRFPYYASLFRYSLALALNGRRPQAELELRRLCNLYPAKQCPIAMDQLRLLADTQFPALKDWAWLYQQPSATHIPLGDDT